MLVGTPHYAQMQRKKGLSWIPAAALTDLEEILLREGVLGPGSGTVEDSTALGSHSPSVPGICMPHEHIQNEYLEQVGRF